MSPERERRWRQGSQSEACAGLAPPLSQRLQIALSADEGSAPHGTNSRALCSRRPPQGRVADDVRGLDGGKLTRFEHPVPLKGY